MTAGFLAHAGKRRDVLVVASSQADAIEACERLYRFLGIRKHDGRSKRARATRSKLLGYRFQQSGSRLGLKLRNTSTGSTLRTAGARAPWPAVDLVVALRPGQWPPERAGKLLDVDRFLAVGPRASDPMHPFETLCRAALRQSGKGCVYAGDVDSLDRSPLNGDEWRRANPDVELHEAIWREADDGAADPDAIASFIRRRLNLGPDAAGIAPPIVRAVEWENVIRRPAPPREGLPVVGLDVGGVLSWTAAVGIWPNGRIEARAATGGALSLAAQERRDAQPADTYSALQRQGVLDVHEGLHEADVDRFVAGLVDEWGQPFAILADRYRAGTLRDAVAAVDASVLDRSTRGESSTEDIRRCRGVLLDGPASIEPKSAGLLSLAIAESRVHHDDDGNAKILKKRGGRSRDDVLQACVLACAEADRLEGMSGGHEDESEGLRN